MDSTAPDLAAYDLILVNSSAGKDSQAMLTYLVRLADAAGVDRSRLIVVHADLGRVEWQGTRELAQEQAEHYGLRFEVVRRAQGDLLDQIEARGKFPSSTARYCTSDQKTSQVVKLMTRLVAERHAAEPKRHADCKHGKGMCVEPVRILNTLGIRAQESPARAKKSPLHRDSASNGKREVTRWLPIFEWTEDEVWRVIRASGVRYHEAYDAGMPRLSCVFCVLAGERELVLAARLNPDLAQTYADVEDRIGFRFKDDLSMAQIRAKAADPTYDTTMTAAERRQAAVQAAADLQPCLF